MAKGLKTIYGGECSAGKSLKASGFQDNDTITQ